MAYNPFFWWDSPTAIEKTEALRLAVIDLGKKYLDVEKVVEELKKLLDDIDETIKQEVSDIINEMYESGEIANIIRDVIEEAAEKLGMNPKTTSLNFSRRFRRFHYMRARNYEESYNDAYYSYMQGATRFTYGGRIYYIYARICSSYSDAQYNDDGILTVVDEYGNDVISTAPLQIYHANGLLVKGGYLYILDCYRYDGENRVISYDISRIQISDIMDGVTNPNIERKTVAYSTPPDYGPSSLCEYNGDIYINCQYALYKFNWNTGAATLEYGNNLRYKPDFDASYMQDVAITDDYVYYLVYRPSCIVRYNKELQAVDWVYNILDIVNDGMFKTGEVESMMLGENDDIILATCQHLQYKQVNQLDCVQFFVGNFSRNNKIATNNHAYSKQGYETERLIVYVDSSNTNLNPNGGASNPFGNIVEALWYVQNIEQYRTAIIRLHSNSYWFGYIATDKNILITSHNGGPYTIGGLFVDGGNVALENINISLTLNHDRDNDGCTNRFLRFRLCNFVLSNIIFNQPATAYFDTVAKIYGIRSDDANGVFSFTSGQGTTQAAFNANANREFTEFQNSSVNGHGHLTGGVNCLATLADLPE